MTTIDLTDALDPDDVPPEWYAERMRLHRDGLLAASDWTQAADDPTGDRAAWAQYRQLLRDAPSDWQVGPSWDAPMAPERGM